MNMSEVDEVELAATYILTDTLDIDKVREVRLIMKKEAEEKKKVRRLERLTRDLSPEGWKILSALMDTYNEDFMRKYSGLLQWHFISIGSRLTEQFIREVSDKVDWTNICTWKMLSENFMREWQDKLNWHIVSRYQRLSWEFIQEIHKKINFNMLEINEHINGEIWNKCRKNNYIRR